MAKVGHLSEKRYVFKLKKERSSKLDLTELFCHVDDFWKAYVPQYRQQHLSSGLRKRQRAGQLWESEIMTIMIHFHQAHYRHFKAYYIEHVQVYLQPEFPHSVQLGYPTPHR